MFYIRCEIATVQVFILLLFMICKIHETRVWSITAFVLALVFIQDLGPPGVRIDMGTCLYMLRPKMNQYVKEIILAVR